MNMKPCALSLFPFIFIFLIDTISIEASNNPLDAFSRPLQNLDIAKLYDLNHSLVDFFLFVLIFIPIAKLTIGRRFGGRDGNVLSGVIGVVLALSLSLAEMRMGFSIRSFGPVAAGILIFIVGLVIFYLIKTLGTGNTAAGSLAFVVTYFMMRATVPNFFLWLEENSWTAWINLVLVVAIMISIIKLFIAIFPKGESWSSGRRLEPSYNANKANLRFRKNPNEGNDQISLIKGSLENITKKGIKESREIIADLKEIIRIINEYGNTDKGRQLIADKIRQIAPRENLILKQLAVIKDIGQRIEKFDFGSFKELRARWDKIPDKERKLARDEILIEKRKVLSDEKLLELNAKFSQYDRGFQNALNMSIASLRANQPGQAKDWLLKAIKCEEEAMILFKEMKSLEDMLLKLTKIEFKALDKEAKEAA